jgi:disulfide bond formation protein DsbB
MDTNILVYMLSVLTLACDIFLIWLFVYFIAAKLNFKIRACEEFISLIRRNAILLSLIISAAATMGSLYFSEILGFEPCELCWFQRIFMYPQVILFAAALWRKKKDILIYSIPLTLFGAIISIYQNYLVVASTSGQTICTTTGPSCVVEYFLTFGFINIPVMALTAFLLLLAIALIAKAGRLPVGKLK